MSLQSRNNPLAHAFEERKLREKAAYDESYSQGKEFTDSTVKNRILVESESDFARLIKLHSPGARVLEIGCGLGLHSRIASKCGALSVIGVDISDEGIKRANEIAITENFPGTLSFQVADVELLPFPDQSFDLIINHEVFSSVDLTKVLPELRRVLKIGGHLVSIECLGHNPIFNWNRRRNAKIGKRTQWAVDHIFKYKDLGTAKVIFNCIYMKHFHLFSILLAPILLYLPKSIGTALIAAIHLCDRALLLFPGARQLSFKVVMDWK